MQVFLLKTLERRAFASLLFLLAFTLLSANAATAQTSLESANRQLKLWQEFSPIGLGFKIFVPQQPVETEIGSFENEKMKMKSFQIVTSGSTYQILAIKLAKPSQNFEQMKEFLQTMMQQQPLNEGSRMFGETYLKDGKVNIKTNIIEGSMEMEQNGMNVTIKSFGTKMGSYILRIQTPILYNAPDQIKEVYKAESDKFFNSFQILDNKKPEAAKSKKK